jgi:methyltransferase (TIGR00027 family)
MKRLKLKIKVRSDRRKKIPPQKCLRHEHPAPVELLLREIDLPENWELTRTSRGRKLRPGQRLEMAKQSVSHTALGAAICRLIEQYQPAQTRLFDDPVIKELVGAPIRFMMQFGSLRNFTFNQTEAAGKGIYGMQICRTRYIDEAAQAALSAGIKQLVILGAGLDTRPYRLPGMAGVNAFEVDLPAAQNDKKSKIKKYLGREPDNVDFIPIDFDTQNLETVFSGSSFDSTSPAVFIWEGVTQYISEESVRQTLTFIGKSAPGSMMIFTYVLKSIIERRSNIPGAEKLMDTVAKDAPWIFGLEPADLQAWLRPFHLAVVEDAGAEAYQERYLKPLGRNLAVFEGERIVQAMVSSPGQ